MHSVTKTSLQLYQRKQNQDTCNDVCSLTGSNCEDEWCLWSAPRYVHSQKSLLTVPSQGPFGIGLCVHLQLICTDDVGKLLAEHIKNSCSNKNLSKNFSINSYLIPQRLSKYDNKQLHYFTKIT